MDSYLSISQIALDAVMNERMKACATQQALLAGPEAELEDPLAWVGNNRYRWAASPGWGEAWTYSLDSGHDNIGSRVDVITDGMILATVQQLYVTPEPT